MGAQANIEVEKNHGTQTIEANSSFSYSVVAGFGLPLEIKTTLKQMLAQPGAKKSATYHRKTTSLTRFSKWQVNTKLKKSDFEN